MNGTGKSTISNYLYAPNHLRFEQCNKSPTQTAPILVYNQTFVQDNFFVSDNLKGIFSLSKENKAAEEKIAKATQHQSELEQSLQDIKSAKEKINQDFLAQKQRAVNEVWKIKTEFTGGDRVLEYCLEGLKGQKEKLFSHLQATPKPDNEPEKDVKVLRDEVETLKGDAAQPQDNLPLLSFAAQDVESDTIFDISILGNTDSEVAALIDKLGNSDWVKQGLAYLPDEIGEIGKPCPFCQEDTITSKFLSSVKGYFDDSYQKQINALEKLRERYKSEIERIPDIRAFTEHSFAEKHKDSLSSNHQALIDILRSNATKIEEKIKSPKAPIKLAESKTAVLRFNDEVAEINATIDTYNERLRNRESALVSLKNEFWSLMRWQYDQTMTRFEVDRQAANKKLQELGDEVTKIDSNLSEAKMQIAAAQKETVNVDAAVDAINAGLLDLGIDDFMVSKYSESRYRVVRSGDPQDAFHSLSEGEKMMISFLYFCELCKGKTSAEDTHAQRIAVIDDPISSLSHIFVFNVGQLIRSIFFKSERFCQVFVLTHSLYFFYELTDPNHERRKETQKLFRISKPSSGSSIQEMKYEEVQNDYQAYWAVINDKTQL